MNPIKKFFKQEANNWKLKKNAEQKYWINYDKSKALDEGKESKEVIEPEIVEENVNAGLIKITYNITTKVEGTGGNISGEGEAVYEIVGKGETNTKDIVVSPNEGYRVDYNKGKWKSNSIYRRSKSQCNY